MKCNGTHEILPIPSHALEFAAHGGEFAEFLGDTAKYACVTFEIPMKCHSPPSESKIRVIRLPIKALTAELYHIFESRYLGLYIYILKLSIIA